MRVHAEDVEVLVHSTEVAVAGAPFTLRTDRAASALVLGLETFTASPVLVCKSPIRTVGLGYTSSLLTQRPSPALCRDAISSAGLVAHLAARPISLEREL